MGYTEEQIQENIEGLPLLGSEESHMYCVCRDRSIIKSDHYRYSFKSRKLIQIID